MAQHIPRLFPSQAVHLQLYEVFRKPLAGSVLTTLCWDPIAPGILMLELHLPIIVGAEDASAPSTPTPALQAVQGRKNIPRLPAMHCAGLAAWFQWSGDS